MSNAESTQSPLTPRVVSNFLDGIWSIRRLSNLLAFKPNFAKKVVVDIDLPKETFYTGDLILHIDGHLKLKSTKHIFLESGIETKTGRVFINTPHDENFNPVLQKQPSFPWIKRRLSFQKLHNRSPRLAHMSKCGCSHCKK